MEKWLGKVAIVTGASSGIGKETCKQLVKKGMIVVGFDRREDRLMELEKELNGKSRRFHFVKVDLCSEEKILEAYEWVKKKLKSVDVLVNCAGIWKESDLLGDTKDWKQIFDTNVIGLSICSKEAIKIMRDIKIKEGHIININSIFGHYRMSFKDIAVYSASKISVTSLTESLRELLCMEDLPIRVTSISPGLVETEMGEAFIKDKPSGMKALKPIDIADAILYALGTPQRVNIAEIIIRPSQSV